MYGSGGGLQIVITREIFVIASYGFRYISPLVKLF